MTRRGSRARVEIVRRIVHALLLALLAVSAVFLAFRLIPGDSLDTLRAARAHPDAIERMRELRGTDEAAWRQLGSWLSGLARGDLGRSIQHGQPVASLIGRAIRNTLPLAATALVLQFALGAFAAWLACRRPGGALDRSVVAGAGALQAMPAYLVALGLVAVFAVSLDWLPVSQMRSIDHLDLDYGGRLRDTLAHLLLPAAALALPAGAGVCLFLREEILDRLERPWVRGARARGHGRDAVLLRHATRNALLPLIQLLGLSLPGLVAGSVVIETLFSWPGMGLLAYRAVLARDEPLILGCTAVATLAVVAGSLVADLLTVAADPRSRESLR